ncbi:MAG: MBL fold metallo-hydrolase [Bacteroidetes bacterium]|nr:MAG: MBL fold metallo-hydrolase [Bacteroidota bacterium]
MYVEQLYTNCLAEAAYYIESDGEAAIIDPIRETGVYLDLAKKRGAKIKYVFETHFHADFISGHIDLAKQTGAQIIFGPGAETEYDIYNAKDKEVFRLGNISLKALHTPGHTPESTCYLLFDESNQEQCLFAGDTLFVGDVGRPDLLDGKMTKEELAGMMYDSLNNKIKVLPDEVIVYPAHGPGSSCGKNLGKETWSTIGHQKKTNYALREMSREEFIHEVTEGLVAPPAYFFSDARINKQGYESLDSVLKKNLKALQPNEVQLEISSGALVLDTRDPDDFEKGFIPGSINIGLNGMFAIWAGTILDINMPMIVVCDQGKEEETITRLARVGYEKIRGYLAGGIASWEKAGFEMGRVHSVNASDFAKKVKSGVSVLDVRKYSEAEGGHVTNATIIPLADLSANLTSIRPGEPIYIHCAGGYRSMIAASMLKKGGLDNVINVYKGWSEIKNTDVPVSKALPVV